MDQKVSDETNSMQHMKDITERAFSASSSMLQLSKQALAQVFRLSSNFPTSNDK